MTESRVCNKCKQGFIRTFAFRDKHNHKNYRAVCGTITRGLMCVECFKEANRVKQRKNKISTQIKQRQDLKEMVMMRGQKACPHCTAPTANRYACDACWRTNRALSTQDAPTFSSRELKLIRKDIGDGIKFKY